MNIVLPVLIFTGVGILAGVLLTVFSSIFEVKNDERVDKINEILPQVNCGSCGFSGCSDYAKAIVEKGAAVNMCRAGGNECASKIAEVMGVNSGNVTTMVAVVACSGDCNVTEKKYAYKGEKSCVSANLFYKGSKDCIYSCLGYGDCAKVCPNNAISVENQLARVNKSLCSGCGLCANACPKGIIKIRDISKQIDVLCSSKDSGKIVKTICGKGCIGCKICEKKCENGAIKVIDNLARIDYDKCTGCGKCVQNCPVGVLRKCGATISPNKRK